MRLALSVPMECTELRRSAIHRPPPALEAKELNELFGSCIRPVILDVREEAQFRTGHLPGAVHAPDSNTTALLSKIARCPKVILVCNDGHMSSTVARMLGVCGYSEVSYLKGGLKAWKEIGAPLLETTRRGEERRVHEGGNPDGPGPIGRLMARLTPPVFFAGLAGAAVLVGVVAVICR